MSPTLSSRRLISDGEMPIFCADASMASTVKARRSNSGDVVFMVVGVEVALSAFEQVRGKVREKTSLQHGKKKENTLCLPRKQLPQPDGGVHHEEESERGGAAGRL